MNCFETNTLEVETIDLVSNLNEEVSILNYSHQSLFFSAGSKSQIKVTSHSKSLVTDQSRKSVKVTSHRSKSQVSESH